jgi:DNA-binding NarL/FixJ family response regulator
LKKAPEDDASYPWFLFHAIPMGEETGAIVKWYGINTDIEDRATYPRPCAMKAGAIEFLTKPFRDDVLLDAIRDAIERSRAALQLDAEMRTMRTCYASLAPREREVMALVVSGLLNKQVGGELGISEITVKAHRGQVMRKMNAESLPDLVTMAARLGLRSSPKD